MASERLQELWTIVKRIPPGTVASYGLVGRSLSQPVSGLLAGRWMHAAVDDTVPWWRVVGSTGDLLIAKKDPHLALLQQKRLEDEGVSFVDGLVEKSYFLYEIPL